MTDEAPTEYWTCAGLPEAFIDRANFEYAIFVFPLTHEGGEIALRMDRLELQGIAGALSEVSAHLRRQTGLRDGHAVVPAVEVAQVGAHKLVGGRIGLELRSDNGEAQIYALTADEAKWLADQLLKLEPEAWAEAAATRQ